MADVPARPGKTAVEMFQAAADGEIAALWIACTNPAQSLPDQATVRRALQRCEFVIVQEAFATTATTAYADLLLPATTWGEKDGTVTNSERRISRVRAAVPAPGQARHDWHIVVDVARRLEALLPTRRADGDTLFPFDTVAEPVERAPRKHARPRPGHHRPELRDAGRARAAAVAAARRAGRRHRRGSTPTVAFPRPTAAPASPRWLRVRWPRSATRITRSA